MEGPRLASVKSIPSPLWIGASCMASKTLLITAAVVIAVGGVGWLMFDSASTTTLASAPATTQPVTPANSPSSALVNSTPTPTPTPTVPVPAIPAVTTSATPSAWARPTPPSALAAWFTVTESERLTLVEQLHPDPRLPSEVVAFFTAEIRDHDLGLVTRNHVANLLMRQDVRDPTLAEVFRGMAEDLSEDYQWREYSVQHWASATDFSADPERQIAGLWRLAETGEQSIPGTVLLHLSYLEERNVSGVPVGFDARIKKLLSDTNANVLTRMTCIGIVADRRMAEAVPLVRDLARGAPQPSVRRCALAALGTMGDVADLDLVQGFAKDQDASIAAAAKGAERRLLAVRQKPSPIPP
jgi:hypothetical protein